MLKTRSRFCGAVPLIKSKPSHQILTVHTVTLEQQKAGKWYSRFDDQRVGRKPGCVSRYGPKVTLRYPLTDLLPQLPDLFHPEIKKLKQVIGKEIEVKCEKHKIAHQNEEEAWKMMATLVDVVAFRQLPATMIKNRSKETKERVQQLLVSEREARKALPPNMKEQIRKQEIQKAAGTSIWKVHCKRRSSGAKK